MLTDIKSCKPKTTFDEFYMCGTGVSWRSRRAAFWRETLQQFTRHSMCCQFGQKVLDFVPSLTWISQPLPGQQSHFLQCPRRVVLKNGICAESNYFSRISSFWVSFSGTEREKSHPGNICSGENFIKNKYIFVYFFFIICTIFVLRKKVPNSGLSISGQHYLFWPS